MARKPKCELIGTDGNVFALRGRAEKALIDVGRRDKVDEFSTRLFECESYDEALTLLHEYVEIV